MIVMMIGKKLVAIQLLVLLILSVIAFNVAQNISSEEDEDGVIKVRDSNQKVHYFDQPPNRVALTNSYAATVMRMLDINLSVVVGMSGDFSDSPLWPELQGTDIIQNSAHSEIDFEAL